MSDVTGGTILTFYCL